MQPKRPAGPRIDRIVETCHRLRADAARRRAPGAAAAVDRSRSRSRSGRRRPPRRSGSSPRTASSAARLERPARRSWRRSGSRGAPSKRLRLLALATFLDSIDESRARHPPRAGSRFRCSTPPAPAPRPSRARRRSGAYKIDPSGGGVVDHASPELRVIRDRLRKQKSRSRSTLESYLRGRRRRSTLQDQVVTERNGRYVLVVKAEHRGGIPGIVHGTSTSGASLFLEPLSTVEINTTSSRSKNRSRRSAAESCSRSHRRVPPARRRSAADDRRGDRARRAAGAGAVLRVDRRRRAGARRRRRLRAAGGAAPAAQEARCPGDHQGDSAGDDPARHRPEHRWQDRRAEDRRAAGDDDAGGPAHPPPSTARACPSSARCSPTSATRQSIEASLSTFSAHITNIASMDRGLVTPALVLARRSRLGDRPDRRRRARRRHRRSLPAPRRHGHRHQPLRSAQDLRLDDGGRGQRGVRLRADDVRADLSVDLRQPRAQPGARESPAVSGSTRRSSPRRARTSARARRSSPSTWRRSTTTCARWSTSTGSRRASG